MPVDIWGDGRLAEATVFSARSLGWDIAPGADVIAVAPLAPTVEECDALIARPATGKRAFAWPTASVTAVQQMIARCQKRWFVDEPFFAIDPASLGAFSKLHTTRSHCCYWSLKSTDRASRQKCLCAHLPSTTTSS